MTTTIRKTLICVLLIAAVLIGYFLLPADVVDGVIQHTANKHVTKTRRNHVIEDGVSESNTAAASRSTSKPYNLYDTAAAAVAIDSEEQFTALSARAKELGVSAKWNPALRRMMLHGRDDVVRNLLADKQFADLETEYNIFVSLIPEKQTEHIIGPSGPPFRDTALKWMGIKDDDKPNGHSVKIALLDTAVDLSAPVLANAKIVSDDLFGLGAVSASHGTMVASLLAGSSELVDGAAKDAEIIAIPVMDADGNGYVFTLADGIVAAADSGAQIISMSLSCPYDSAVLRAAVDYAISKGCVIVAAAGNEGVAVDGTSTVGYPAAYDGVIAVGAVNASGGRAGFSSTGKELTVVAPGVGIYAEDSNGTQLFGGTSAATPLAAGAIAYVMGEKENISAVEAAKMLLEHTNDAGMPGVDEEYGLGQLNVERALKSDVQGYSDHAAADIVINKNDDGTRSVYFTAQNRGNETIGEITLNCTLVFSNTEDITETIEFNDVKANQSVSLKIDVPDGMTPVVGHVFVSSSSEDGDPDNNTKIRLLEGDGDN